MIDTFILMQWLIMTDKDTTSMSDGHSFSTDPLLSVVKISAT